MYPIVEFCVSNLASCDDDILGKLEADPELDVVEYGCLDHCGLCGESLYALVNGEVVTGKTSEELMKNIYQYIEDNPMF